MKWKKFTIESTTAAEESVAYLLSELGIDSVEIEDLLPVDDTIQGGTFEELQPDRPEDDGKSYISFYLEEDCDSRPVLARISEMLEEMKSVMDAGSCRITEAESDEADWRDNWKDFFHSFTVGDLLICPTWEEPELLPDQTLIRIDPGIAFGTGKHESTHLVLERMQKENLKGMQVLDLGFGSGILSIAALKLGAAHVTGTDIDPDCIGSAHSNFQVNNLDPADSSFYIGNLAEDPDLQSKVGTGYDLVFANILADIIISMAKQIAATLKEDGLLITSGIIDFKENEVAEALLAQGLVITEINHEGEWVSITARKCSRYL